MLQHLMNDHGEWTYFLTEWATCCAYWGVVRGKFVALLTPPPLEPLQEGDVGQVGTLIALFTRCDGRLVASRFPSHTIGFGKVGLPFSVNVDTSPEAAQALVAASECLRRVAPDGITWSRLAARLRRPDDPDDTRSAEAAIRLLSLGYIHGVWDILPRSFGPYPGWWKLWRFVPSPVRRALVTRGFLFPVWHPDWRS